MQAGLQFSACKSVNREMQHDCNEQQISMAWFFEACPVPSRADFELECSCSGDVACATACNIPLDDTVHAPDRSRSAVISQLWTHHTDCNAIKASGCVDGHGMAECCLSSSVLRLSGRATHNEPRRQACTKGSC